MLTEPRTRSEGSWELVDCEGADMDVERSTNESPETHEESGINSTVSRSATPPLNIKKTPSWSDIAGRKPATPPPVVKIATPGSKAKEKKVWTPKFKVVEVVKPTLSESPLLVDDEEGRDSEFYARQGSDRHSLGLKLRPDEKRRKDWIVNKKEAQRANNKR